MVHDSCAHRQVERRVSREAELIAWLGVARVGEWVVYHHGRLDLDRTVGLTRLGERERRALDRLAVRALEEADAGRVHLVQRRRDDDAFDYIAVAAGCGRRLP